ncbi:hypothetical protein M885DRAFT_588562 [Pelagophyceae sp. CCMP2097]|nr:hypothetical protein M885DRAFT_588562 [Pelagophyceae sp. CCMP2097]
MFAVLDDGSSSEEEAAAPAEAVAPALSASARAVYASRMAEEVEALQSIYGDSDVTTAKGILSVRVQHAQISATLRVERPLDYPDAALRVISVVFDGGARTPAALLPTLEQRASALRGEVAVFELSLILAECVEKVSEQGATLHDEMISREALQKTNALQHFRTAQLSEAKRRRGAEERQRLRRAAALEQEKAMNLMRLTRLVEDPNEAHTPPTVAKRAASPAQKLEAASFGALGESDGDVSEGSRYACDFKELHILGRGGFGQVLKCQNRLDKKFYAVKKVVLPWQATRKEVTKQLREVEALANVFHPHCVRYYQAWIEGEAIKQKSDKDKLEEWSDEDEDDDSDDDEAEDGASCATDEGDLRPPHARLKPAAVEAFGLDRVLYIQMEFCATTLRELIDRGTLCKRVDDVWRLIREMCEALAYLHEAGTVHRDLKPANVFVDGNSSIKVGDFGLATTTKSSLDDVDCIQSDSFLENSATSLTGGVGTALYRAPEVAGKTTGYDVAADMFSFGVIIFEIIHPPFATAMERIERLTQLRNQGAVFATAVESRAVVLVKSLVTTDAASRPSASTVLGAPQWLPARTELEKPLLLHAQKSLTDPRSKTRHVLLDALFLAQTPEHTDASYDSRPDAGPEPRKKAALAFSLRAVFEAHGAVESASPSLRPRPPPFGAAASAVPQREASRGDPRDGLEASLRRARAATRDSLKSRGAVRSFEFGAVFLDEAFHSSSWRDPSSFSSVSASIEKDECAYSVVAKRGGSACLEGETLALVSQRLPRALGIVAELRVSHSGLASALAELCTEKAPRSLRDAVKALKGGKHDASTLLKAVEDAISKFVDEVDDGPAALPAASEATARQRAGAALFELQCALEMARVAFGANEPPAIVVDLDLVAAEPFADDGLFFALVHSPNGSTPKLREKGLEQTLVHSVRPAQTAQTTAPTVYGAILASGGRFDGIVSRHAPPSAAAGYVAVGARFDVDALCAAATTLHLLEKPPHVIVVDESDAAGAGQRDAAKLAVATALRDAALRVEQLDCRLLLGAQHKRRKASARGAAEALCHEWGVPWLLLVHRDFPASRRVTLRRVKESQNEAQSLFLHEAVQRIVEWEHHDVLDRQKRLTDVLSPSTASVSSASPATRPLPDFESDAEKDDAGAASECAVRVRFFGGSASLKKTPRAAHHKRRADESSCDDARTMRRIASALEGAGVDRAAFAPQDAPIETRFACCAVDAPLALLRLFGQKFVEDRGEAVELLEAAPAAHRGALRSYLEILDEACESAKVLYAYSNRDDALDLLWLPKRRKDAKALLSVPEVEKTKVPSKKKDKASANKRTLSRQARDAS